MLREWEREHPGRIDRIFRAMGNVDASHLMDRNLFPFTTLRPGGTPNAAGDRAFDDDLAACAAPDAIHKVGGIGASPRGPWPATPGADSSW